MLIMNLQIKKGFPKYVFIENTPDMLVLWSKYEKSICTPAIKMLIVEVEYPEEYTSVSSAILEAT